jgi:predicted O-methyltransferase YrrM
LAAIEVPRDLDAVLDAAWEAARDVPGFLMEAEARLLGTIAACAPAGGAIVEIGSFKGKSTVMLAKVAAHYGLGKIVAIDPHNFNNEELAGFKTDAEATSYREFLGNLEAAGVTGQVEVHRAYSTDVSPEWNRTISFLWIDGDHSYKGAKADFDGFFPHVLPQGIVALHDALHEFSGPIRVFVEEMLCSDRFGAAGFVHSIAWSQFRPEDGIRFRKQRAALERSAARLIPLVKDERELHGLAKLRFKLARTLVPHKAIIPGAWAELLSAPVQ